MAILTVRECVTKTSTTAFALHRWVTCGLSVSSLRSNAATHRRSLLLGRRRGQSVDRRLEIASLPVDNLQVAPNLSKGVPGFVSLVPAGNCHSRLIVEQCNLDAVGVIVRSIQLQVAILESCLFNCNLLELGNFLVTELEDLELWVAGDECLSDSVLQRLLLWIRRGGTKLL